MLQKFHYLIYRLKYRYAPILNLKVPVDVSLELSSNCNMACGYCYHAKPQDLPFQRGFMTWEIAEKVLREAAEIGVHSVKTNFRGESTMNKDFERITAYARELAHAGVFIDRITNSNFKFGNGNESIFRGLANQTKVKVSLDSFDKTVLETQRKGAQYGLIMANIDKFYSHHARVDSGCKLVIQSVRTTLNRDEDLAGEIQRRWPGVEYSIRDMVAGRVESEKVEELQTRTRDTDDRQTCIQAHARLMVHWDGRVAMCCPDISGKIIIGDASKTHIKDIFNSELARSVRRDLKTKEAFKMSPCKTCSSFESYANYKAPFHA